MNKNIEVRIEKLDPMRMISAYGFGSEPERIASEKIIHFAKSKGLYMEGKSLGTFGFNNPNPSAGSPNYGYEIWLPVGPEIQPEGDLRVVAFEGGLYAVTTFKNLNRIGEVWGQMVRWRETSKYKCGHHQWLEELLTPAGTPFEEYAFNLYLPISE